MDLIERQNSPDLAYVDDVSILDPYDLSEIDFEGISKLWASDSSDFDFAKLMECNGLDVDSNCAPPSAVRIEEPTQGNTLLNAKEKEPSPPSPETILHQSASTGVAGTLLESPSGNYLQPTSPGSVLQPSSPGLILQADSLMSLQLAVSDAMLQAAPEMYWQPGSPEIMQQANSGAILQISSPGFMAEKPSPTPILQPASLETFLQTSSGANLQHASPMPSVNSPMPHPNQSINPESNQPASATQPIVVVMPSQSYLESLQSYPQNEKRGRKSNDVDGVRPRRPRKLKLYEMEPFEDEGKERRRKNAVIAKNHRENQKKERYLLKQQLKRVIDERNILMKKVEMLQQQGNSVLM